VVERVIFKDIAEEVVMLGPEARWPPLVSRIRVTIPQHIRLRSVSFDVFDGFLRHLSGILEESGVLGETEFWAVTGACMADYTVSVPHLAGALGRHDLFAEEFALSCLNRLQLRNNRQVVDLFAPTAAKAASLHRSVGSTIARSSWLSTRAPWAGKNPAVWTCAGCRTPPRSRVVVPTWWRGSCAPCPP
jgi:siderophore synthetase component